MTLHLNLPGSHHRSSEHQQELRETRRLLRERIRNDWEYPTLPAYRSCGKREPDKTEEDIADTIAGFRFHTPSSGSGHERKAEGGGGGSGNGSGSALGLDFDPVEWREREYSDLDVSDTETECAATATPTPTTPNSTKSTKRSEYKFDGPDSVGQQLDARRQARKWKRQVVLQAEMEWNDGLTHWMRRRDIWCSARSVTEVRMQQQQQQTNSSSNQEASSEEQEDGDADSASATDSTTSRPSTAASSTGEEEEEEEEDPSSSTPDSTPSVSPDLTSDLPPTNTPTPQHHSQILLPLEILLPLAPPLLPNHPIRRRISPNTYPEIYSKIILQSRSPSIPINLRTLINALVQGWKDDGEWPPKTGPVEKSIGRKKGTGREGSFKDNMRAVGRVLKITGTS